MRRTELSPARPLRSRRALVAAVAGAALLLGACSGDDSTGAGAATTTSTSTSGGSSTTSAGDGSTTTTAAPTDITVFGRGKPNVEVPAGAAPTELVIDDLVEGDGAEATEGSRVTVHYVGVGFDDGEEFDSSWGRGEPFQVVLGQGMVIDGWEQGFAGMKVGGQRRLVIPPALAYGVDPAGHELGGKTLVFVVDLVAVDQPVDPADEPKVSVPAVAPTELTVEDLTVGTGAELEPGDVFSFHYVIAQQDNGETLDSSWQSGFPLTLTMTPEEVGDSIYEGLLGMQAGGRRQLGVPGTAASGAEEERPSIVILIDLVSIEKA